MRALVLLRAYCVFSTSVLFFLFRTYWTVLFSFCKFHRDSVLESPETMLPALPTSNSHPSQPTSPSKSMEQTYFVHILKFNTTGVHRVKPVGVDEGTYTATTHVHRQSSIWVYRYTYTCTTRVHCTGIHMYYSSTGTKYILQYSIATEYVHMYIWPYIYASMLHVECWKNTYSSTCTQ